jgi:hypothetical protein
MMWQELRVFQPSRPKGAAQNLGTGVFSRA